MFVYIRSTAFVIVVTQKLFLQQSKNVTAKCTENLSPSPCILFSLSPCIDGWYIFQLIIFNSGFSTKWTCTFSWKNFIPTLVYCTVHLFSALYFSEKYLIFEKYYLVLLLLRRLDNFSINFVATFIKRYHLLLWQVVRGFWLL